MVDDDALDSCAPLHLVQFCFDASEIQIDGSSKAAGPRTTPARPGRLAQQDPPAAVAAAVVVPPLLHDSTRPRHHSDPRERDNDDPAAIGASPSLRGAVTSGDGRRGGAPTFTVFGWRVLWLVLIFYERKILLVG